MSLIGLVALIGASSFSTGYGEWSPGAGGMAALTRSEERFIEAAMKEYEGCSGDECRDATVHAIADVLNDRRKLRSEHGGSAIFDALRSPCERLVGNAQEQRRCFQSRLGLTFDTAMKMAGFVPAGVNRTGFSCVRVGMRETQVDYVLKTGGVRLSYSAYGGHEVEMLRYGAGGKFIIVTLKDGEVSGKAQSGLQ